jgi:hypothetical protein
VNANKQLHRSYPLCMVRQCGLLKQVGALRSSFILKFDRLRPCLFNIEMGCRRRIGKAFVFLGRMGAWGVGAANRASFVSISPNGVLLSGAPAQFTPVVCHWQRFGDSKAPAAAAGDLWSPRQKTAKISKIPSTCAIRQSLVLALHARVLRPPRRAKALKIQELCNLPDLRSSVHDSHWQGVEFDLPHRCGVTTQTTSGVLLQSGSMLSHWEEITAISRCAWVLRGWRTRRFVSFDWLFADRPHCPRTGRHPFSCVTTSATIACEYSSVSPSANQLLCLTVRVLCAIGAKVARRRYSDALR